MTTGQRTTAVAAFEGGTQAEYAIDQLRRAGFTHEQLGIIMRKGEVEGATDVTPPGSAAGEGALTGLVAGGIIGGLIAVGALLIPGIGPVVGGGVVATLLTGAGAGAAAGGVIGALTGMGVPEEEAQFYHGEFEAGRPVVVVQAGDRYPDAVAILQRSGGRMMPSTTRVAPEPAATEPIRPAATAVPPAPAVVATTAPAADTALPTDLRPDRIDDYATHPLSAAIEDTSTAMGASAAPHSTGSLQFGGVRGTGTIGGSPAGRPPATPQVSTTAPESVSIDGAATRIAGTANIQGGAREMERGLAADHTTDGQPTTPVASGAIGEPLQRHEASAQMIRGEVGETAQQGPIAQGPTAAEQMGHVDDVRGEPAEQTPFAEPPARTAARMHTPSREGVARTGENRVFTTTELLPGTNNRPLEIESRAQPEIPAEPSMTGPLGHWPVAADDPHAAGKYVEGEEQVATGTTEGATHIPIVTATGEPASVYDEELAREQMLGNERPPYENTGDDLQRVGATTKLAPWATLPTWDQAAPHYREQWQNRAGASGGRWEDVEPGYRYGYEMAAEPRHHGRQWSEAEPELRAAYSDWSQRCGYRGSNWTDMRERAREAWENVQGNGEGMTDPESRRIE